MALLAAVGDKLTSDSTDATLLYDGSLRRPPVRRQTSTAIYQSTLARRFNVAFCKRVLRGANRGYYASALSKIAAQVGAFEPYPAAARFARAKLGKNVRVREFPVSNYSGFATLHIPQRGSDIDIHFATLKPAPAGPYREITVRVATIDQFEFDDIGFIKIDAEGSEMEVIDGARMTIRRCRPNMLVELLASFNRDASACIERIEATIGYASRIMVAGKIIGCAISAGGASNSY